MKPYLKFLFFGREWKVYKVSQRHKALGPMPGEKEGLYGVCLYDEFSIYLWRGLSAESVALTLAHEIEHIIEDWALIDHTIGCLTEPGADQRTDMISKGWIYLIRHNPELMKLLYGKTLP